MQQTTATIQPRSNNAPIDVDAIIGIDANAMFFDVEMFIEVVCVVAIEELIEFVVLGLGAIEELIEFVVLGAIDEFIEVDLM